MFKENGAAWLLIASIVLLLFTSIIVAVNPTDFYTMFWFWLPYCLFMIPYYVMYGAALGRNDYYDFFVRRSGALLSAIPPIFYLHMIWYWVRESVPEREKKVKIDFSKLVRKSNLTLVSDEYIIDIQSWNENVAKVSVKKK